MPESDTDETAKRREDYWGKFLIERGFRIADQETESLSLLVDALLLILCESGEQNSNTILSTMDRAFNNLVPGGLLLLVCPRRNGGFATLWESIKSSKSDAMESKWTLIDQSKSTESMVFEDDHLQVICLQRRLCQIQERSCPWLSSKHSLSDERTRVEEATVPLTTDEIKASQLSEPSLERAVERMQRYGYCILPRLLNPHESQAWGDAVLKDLKAAAAILLREENVDILNPHTSQQDPQSYRELSMREDLRMDIRDGPQLRLMRRGKEPSSGKSRTEGDIVLNKPIVLHGNNDTTSDAMPENDQEDPGTKPSRFFRQNTSILQIVRRVMNPKVGSLYKGNFGRWNFSGSGPDGSFQDLRLSAVGGIVSLPGSADQALHADTPHLFETQTLPAHYINAFTLGCAGDERVGCTAFVHGSHRLEFTAEYMAEPDSSQTTGKKEGSSDRVFDFLVRPQLELGDVILFDCRTLHFGLANTSDHVERPLLYCNMTHSWFTDVKNWDNHHPIFKEGVSL